VWLGVALLVAGLIVNCIVDPGPDRGDPALSVGKAIAALAPVFPGLLLMAWAAYPAARLAAAQRRAADAWLWIAVSAALQIVGVSWSFVQDTTGPHHEQYGWLLIVGWLLMLAGAVRLSWSARRRARSSATADAAETAPASTSEPADSPEAAPGWPWWYAPLALVVVYAASYAVVVPLDLLTPLSENTATLILEACAVVTVLVLARRRGPFSRARLGLRAMTITPGRAALWVVCSLLAGGLLIGIYDAIVPPGGHLVLFEHRPHGTLTIVAFAFGAVVGAPVSEELLFRGLFYRALRSSLRAWPAILISSAIFGLMHWVGGDPLVSAGPRAILGVFLCLLYERTGSLYPGMAMHAAINSSVIAWAAPAVWWIPLLGQVAALTVAVALSVRDGRRKKYTDRRFRADGPPHRNAPRPPRPITPPRAA
jgi:membrane protease YdiL (CAAX protease family)